MRTNEALQIIQSLANGLDPQTSRELPPGTPFEQPQVIRALFAAVRALEAASQQEDNAAPSPSAQPAPSQAAAPAMPRLSVNASPPAPIAPPPATPAPATPAPAAPASFTASTASSTGGYFDRPPNAGKAWSREEDARLANGFDRGVSLEVLAQIHARTLASIQSRLEKLGKLPPSQNTAG